jgi:hypothetical protein
MGDAKVQMLPKEVEAQIRLWKGLEQADLDLWLKNSVAFNWYYLRKYRRLLLVDHQSMLFLCISMKAWSIWYNREFSSKKLLTRHFRTTSFRITLEGKVMPRISKLTKIKEKKIIKHLKRRIKKRICLISPAIIDHQTVKL